MLRRRTMALLPVLLILAPAADLRAGESENWERLRSLPREERQALSDKLRQFDSLPRDEREAIRSLDRQVTESENRRRYEEVLRRYHLWLASLSEDQRKRIAETPADQRMSAITDLLHKQRLPGPGSHHGLFLQVADYGGLSPFELGNKLQVWFALDPAQRASLVSLSGIEWSRKMAELDAKLRLKHLPRPSPADERELFARLKQRAQKRADLVQFLKRIDDGEHLKDEAKLKVEGPRVREMKRRLAENFYFLERPPEAVPGDNLLRFQSALPPWIRKLYDHLPPEEARRRLTILYRFVFASPKEMPEEKKAEAVKAPTPRAGAPPAAPPPPAP